MIWLAVSLLFLFVSTEVAIAQTLVVRTGEHGDFTRIVTNLPDATTPTVLPKAYGLEIQFPTKPGEVDVTNVFARIGRNRIANILLHKDERTISVELACKCGFKTTTQDGALLIIDVGENFPIESILDESGKSTSAKPHLESSVGARILPLIFSRQHGDSHFLQLFDQNIENSMNAHSVEGLSQGTTQEQPKQNSMDSRLSGVDATLSNAINLATKRGVLKRDQIYADKEEQSEATYHLKPIDNVKINIDIDKGAEDLAIDRLTDDDTNCLAESDLNISEWSTSQDFSEGLALWHRSLVQDFDKPDPASALALARHYLYFGFGVEAMVALSLAPNHEEGYPVISSLSRIMDQGWDVEDGIFRGMLQCDGPAALWSAMSLEVLPRASGLNTRSLRRAFEALPRNLKEYIGPRLSMRLSNAGEKITADAILASISENNHETSPYVEMSKAKINHELENQPKAQSHLEEVVRTNSELTPIALIDLVYSKVIQGQAVEEDLVELIGSYVFENRGTKLESDLTRTYALALAYSGQFKAAVNFLISSENVLTVSAHLETMSQLIERLQSHATDMDFLAIATRTRLPDMTIEARRVLMERLLSLGFTDLALRYAQPSGEAVAEISQQVAQDSVDPVFGLPRIEQAERPLQSEVEPMTRDGSSVRVFTGLDDGLIENLQSADLQENQPALSSMDERVRAGDPTDENVLRLADLMFGHRAQPESLAAEESKGPQFTTLGQAKNLISESSSTRVKLKEFLDNFQLVQ
jgi:hypothetical protein